SLNMLRDSYLVTLGVPQLTYSFGRHAQFITRFFHFVTHLNIEILISEFERVALELSFNANTKILFVHFALSISKLIRKA
ncbi:MAG: DNA polymerase III subunit delta, partial [Rikenellaceae bacterium]|nr:DNA polymerase III subunit delta [Rikenellaceae bacterium]